MRHIYPEKGVLFAHIFYVSTIVYTGEARVVRGAS